MDKQIKNIIIGCLNGYEVSKIILFGSRARDDFDYKSDYDILIVLKNELERNEIVELKSLLRKKLADSNIAADILIGSDSYFNLAKNQIGNVIKYAFEEGKFL